MPKRRLFVCSGNVARSQIAESYARVFDESNYAYSAGTDPTAHLRYSHPTDTVIQVMAEEGFDVSGNSVDPLTEQMLAEADEAYVLCPRRNCPDYLRNSEKARFWRVKDPSKMDVNGMRQVRDRIKAKVSSIIR